MMRPIIIFSSRSKPNTKKPSSHITSITPIMRKLTKSL